MTSPPPLSPSASLRLPTVLAVLDSQDVRSVVEVGPGLGATGWRIALGREYFGYEPDDQSFSVAFERLRALPNATVVNSLVPDEPEIVADALVAFEVLEHLEDDAAALDSWVRWVRPGGTILLSVPSHQHRFGPWDEAVGHYRRYGKTELIEKMQRAGLTDVEVRAYGMPVGYVLEWVRQKLLVRRLDDAAGREEGTRRSGRSFQPKSWIGRLVPLAMAPFRLMQRPFAHTELGTGWIAWARRPS